MNTPGPGWSLEQAMDLLAQGYAPAHVEVVTGYDARYLHATAHPTTHPTTHPKTHSSTLRGPRGDG